MKKKCYQKTIAKLAIASLGVFLFGITEVFSVPSAPVYADTSFNDRSYICKIQDQHPDEATLVAIDNSGDIHFENQDPHHFANRVIIPEFVFFNGKRCPITRIENSTDQNSLFSNPDAVTEVVIPASVKTIGNNAFLGMHNLRGVNFQFNSQLENIGASAFAGCRSLKSIYLPNAVKELGDSAFENTAVASVRLPEKLEKVGKKTFFNSPNLVDLEIPKGVKTIGEEMFAGSRELKAVNFPDSLQRIGDQAFYQSGIREAIIPDSVASLGEGVFMLSALESIKFPQGQKIIPKRICSNTHLSEVNLPSDTQEIGEDAFSYTPLETVILPEKLKCIGNVAFFGCYHLSSIAIPDGVKEIGKAAFKECDLTEVTLPSSIKEVKKYAFADCIYLHSVLVEQGSNQPTVFGRNVFTRCDRLTLFTAHKPVGFVDPIHLAGGTSVFQNQHCSLNQNGFFVPKKWLVDLSNE